ncbi:hypothetical protein ABIC21_000558 [Pseudarthrobacter sp. PvP090]
MPGAVPAHPANWREGHGSKAHRLLQIALEASPTYRLARLSNQMI